jgi:hypothetical protein
MMINPKIGGGSDKPRVIEPLQIAKVRTCYYHYYCYYSFIGDTIVSGAATPLPFPLSAPTLPSVASNKAPM